MPRPLRALINIAAMRHNLEVARRHASGARVWAIIKANAYGHGLEHAYEAFDTADGLGLIEVEGALAIREFGWRKPILLLEGFFEVQDLPVLSKADIQVAVHCDEQIDMLAATRLDQPMHVHLKMNSGMNRLGFKPEVFPDAYRRLQALPNVRQISLMTHFANADEVRHPRLSVDTQFARFQQATAGLLGERSLANSGADLLHPAVCADWVRAGIMLYGGSPGTQTAESFDLKAAMQFEGALIGIQSLQAGEPIGYGSRFLAPKPMCIGVVACGYADGYPRHAPDGTPVLVNGVRTRIVGTVSMDMLTVDLDPIPDASVGSSVTLWGEQLPIDEVARNCGTIGYELMCAVARRVPLIPVRS